MIHIFNVYVNAVIRGENGDGEDGSEISGGRKRGEITWLLVGR